MIIYSDKKAIKKKKLIDTGKNMIDSLHHIKLKDPKQKKNFVCFHCNDMKSYYRLTKIEIRPVFVCKVKDFIREGHEEHF